MGVIHIQYLDPMTTRSFTQKSPSTVAEKCPFLIYHVDSIPIRSPAQYFETPYPM